MSDPVSKGCSPDGPRVPWLGKLSGDLIIRRGNFTFYFPWVTGLLISIFLTPLWVFSGK